MLRPTVGLWVVWIKIKRENLGLDVSVFKKPYGAGALYKFSRVVVPTAIKVEELGTQQGFTYFPCWVSLQKQSSSNLSLCILSWLASARSLILSLAGGEKCSKGTGRQAGERKWKIQIDRQKGWNFCRRKTAKGSTTHRRGIWRAGLYIFMGPKHIII